jgi:hypothetical protein
MVILGIVDDSRTSPGIPGEGRMGLQSSNSFSPLPTLPGNTGEGENVAATMERYTRA